MAASYRAQKTCHQAVSENMSTLSQPTGCICEHNITSIENNTLHKQAQEI